MVSSTKTKKTPYKKNYKKKGTGRKVAFNKRIYHSPIFHFKRWANTGVWSRSIGNSGSGVPIWPVNNLGEYKCLWKQPMYRMTQLPGFTEFSNLFRYYRINSVVTRCTMMWEGTHGNIDIGEPNYPPLPLYKPYIDWRAFSFIDKGKSKDWEDEADPNVSLSAAKQLSSFRMYSSAKKIVRVCHPMGISPVDNDGSLQPGAMSNVKWYRTEYMTTPLYGLVFGIQPAIPTANLSGYWKVGYSMDMCYYISFKGVK